MRNRYLSRAIFAMLLLAFIFQFPMYRLSAETITIPGDVNAISFYTRFFYNLPNEDFIYYLNDRLLLSEDPDGRLFPRGKRDELDKILAAHSRLQDFIRECSPDGADNRITLDLRTTEGQRDAEDLCSLLGLHLEKEKEGYRVYVDESSGKVDYYKFAMLDINTLVKQVNKTSLLYFKLQESQVLIPWSLQFINEITGLTLEPATFFETMVRDERLSLLLGILYRLTPREIEFINSLSQTPRLGAWKRLYKDTQFMLGLFVLAPALRAADNRLLLPGGEEALDFWYNLVGEDPEEYPLAFLERLTTGEDGKLNYLYLFSFFLPESTRKALFFDYDFEKVLDMLAQVSLSRKEQLGLSTLPGLRDFNFYTLLYALRVKEGQIQFPAGVSAWLRVITGKDQDSPPASAHELIVELLKRSKGGGKGMSALQKFVSLYTKFFDRPHLLTEEVLAALWDNYDEVNVLVDFIEKIPIKNPETVLSLFTWRKTFGGVNAKDRAIFTAIFQSLFEIFSHASRYAPTNFDYDRLVMKLIRIPMTKALFCGNMFTYFRDDLGIALDRERVDRAFLDFVLAGVGNLTVRIRSLDYRYLARNLYRDLIKEILETQETCSLSALIEINDLLERVLQGKVAKGPGMEGRIQETFLLLPHADMSKDAPQLIRERVVVYARAALEKDVARLIDQVKSSAPREELTPTVNKIRGNYLLPHLKDYLLGVAYALNARNAQLRFFINPNLIRLHDFVGRDGETPWNFCGRPKSNIVPKARHGVFGSREVTTFSGYYLRGGLSRLNIVLASIWKDHLFGRNVIYDADHVKAFITNLLDFYPIPRVNQGQDFAALLVEFAVELIQGAKNNDNLRKDLIEALGTITTGYHYRKICAYLDGQVKDYYLFFNEYLALGERFFRQSKYLDEFSAKDRLQSFHKEPLSSIARDDMDRFGGIYYHTFGSLKTSRPHLFPQELTNFFASGWTGGEMINEFKVKVAYHAHKKGIPATLLGEFLYDYLSNTSKRFYSQNYEKDYFSTYFIFDIFNNSYLNRILKKSQRKGYLRIK